MFCANCGAQVPDGTKFCPSWGTPCSTGEKVKQAAEDGKLSSAKIYQNREVPTGSVVADIEGEGKKKVYVTDVKDAQKLLEGYGIHPEVADVPQESV